LQYELPYVWVRVDLGTGTTWPRYDLTGYVDIRRNQHSTNMRHARRQKQFKQQPPRRAALYTKRLSTV